jgi:hypothetical protein
MVGSELDASAVRSTACEAGTHAATPQSLGPVAGNLNNIKDCNMNVSNRPRLSTLEERRGRPEWVHRALA